MVVAYMPQLGKLNKIVVVCTPEVLEEMVPKLGILSISVSISLPHKTKLFSTVPPTHVRVLVFII